ncbi:MAG: hypothetical protein HUJ25_14020 [Crocinitomicaceae bacterium]|nr:hypothetical protein [Crocinitomicaceae bacterium]
MKRHYFFYLFFVLLGVTACKQKVYLTVYEPAAVFLEKEYETVGVINRTYSSGATKVLDVVDNALTLEGNLDHKGSKSAVTGLYDQLTVNERFKRVVMLDSMTVKDGGIDIFPAQLEWDEVQRICDENQVQLLFVLEVFDTDTKVDVTPGTTTKNTPLGQVTVPTSDATMTTKIKTGWRIYDPKNKWVRDEFWLQDRMVQRGRGTVQTFGTLAKRGQAVTQLSMQIGRFYAGRVENQAFRVWRNYFKSGSRNLRTAKRMSEVGDWDGAAQLWEEDTKSPKRKVAGRACYNMAIYAEINGDLYGALEWAQKSYSKYGNREAKNYANILRRRVQRWEENQRRKEVDDQN